MSDKYKTKDVGQSSDKTTNVLLSLSEASTYAGVSTRTIERHATVTKYQTVVSDKNGKKVKCYELSWLTDKFKNVVSDMSDTKSKTLNNKGFEDTTRIKNKDKKQNVVSDMSESYLKEHLDFLTKELQFKSDLIIKLQDSNSALLESEQKTKMLLADLQLQQKTLLLDKPSAELKGKKSGKIWWALFFLLMAVCGVILYFGISFLQNLIQSFAN